jgi:beta-galactosidase
MNGIHGFALCSSCRIAALAVGATGSIPLSSRWRFVPENVAGAEAAEFDDSTWSDVRVPHDWAIAGPVDPNGDGATGKQPWRGVGWYRTSFKLDREAGDRVYIDFDGVMAFPQVYVNGQLAGEWDYGYTSFRVDATPFVNLNGPGRE